MTRVAVLGATGFVGRAVSEALRRHSHDVLPVSAPRLGACTAAEATRDIRAAVVNRLNEDFSDATAVINCAGMADAGDAAESQMMAANASLVAHAAVAVDGRRFIHVSSAAVQGRAAVLDASLRYATFSPYSRSKRAGEAAALTLPGNVIVYRPPGVHGPDRHVTKSIARLARSPLSSVAWPGDQPTPQALIDNVGDALAFLVSAKAPPRVVSHPSEDLTVSRLLALLGGREPRRLPATPARSLIWGAHQLGRHSPQVAANARRLELLWLGQNQASSWLTTAGWRAPVGHDGWRRLGQRLQAEGTHSEGELR